MFAKSISKLGTILDKFDGIVKPTEAKILGVAALVSAAVAYQGVQNNRHNELDHSNLVLSGILSGALAFRYGKTTGVSRGGIFMSSLLAQNVALNLTDDSKSGSQRAANLAISSGIAALTFRGMKPISDLLLNNGGYNHLEFLAKESVDLLNDVGLNSKLASKAQSAIMRRDPRISQALQVGLAVVAIPKAVEYVKSRTDSIIESPTTSSNVINFRGQAI